MVHGTVSRMHTLPPSTNSGIYENTPLSDAAVGLKPLVPISVLPASCVKAALHSHSAEFVPQQGGTSGLSNKATSVIQPSYRPPNDGTSLPQNTRVYHNSALVPRSGQQNNQGQYQQGHGLPLQYYQKNYNPAQHSTEQDSYVAARAMASQYAQSNNMLPITDAALHEMTMSFQNSVLQQQQFHHGGGGNFMNIPGGLGNRLSQQAQYSNYPNRY